MKQDAAKKSKKWLWIVIAVVALLAAAVAVGFLFGGWGKEPAQTSGDETPTSAVYWNLDRIQYTKDSETGLSTREPDENGLYTFRLLSEGKVVELKTADKQLVYYIDSIYAFGVVLDDSGLLIDVLDVNTVASEAAKDYYVKRVEGNVLMVNSSVAMNGLDMTFALTDVARVIDVRPDSETLGQAIGIEVMDLVCVYCDTDGNVTDVYIMERSQTSELYLRLDTFFDSTMSITTRTPDANGVYTIPFALRGEKVQLKCKIRDVVTDIDAGSGSSQVMGLTFDEEGYITGVLNAATAVRGKLLCNAYNVTAMDGNNIEATRLLKGSEQGKKTNFTITESTQIVMNEDGCGHTIGQLVGGLVDYDRVMVWTDVDNNAVYILIAQRKVVDDNVYMYFLKNRKWDSTNKVTTRVPDEKGYYVYELAAKGKMVTVKTKSKDMANKLDGTSLQYFGLRVEKNIVKEYFAPYCISGGYGIGGTRYITDAMGSVVRIVSGSDFNSGSNYMLSANTEIYNMTGYNGKLGSKTTLQVGDRIVAQRDVGMELTHVYVLDRPIEGAKVYYNSSRQFTSTTMETTRVPDAEGYYVYTVYCDGKEMQVKTKDKSIANIIDEQNRPIVAMKVNKNGIVTAAGPAIAAMEYGGKTYNGSYVERINSDNSLNCYYFSNGVKTPNGASYKMAKDCKIFNVSANYSDHCGEKATLKVGDRIQALRDTRTNEIKYIWIVSRMIDSPLYVNHTPMKTTDENGKLVTTRTPDADGYYSVELFVDGKMKTFRTKSKDLMSKVDGNSAESPFAMKTNGDIILVVDEATTSKYASNAKAAFQDVMKISGKTITTERMKPGQSNTGATVEFTYTSKTKIYDISYYSENRFQKATLKKGDRVSVYTDIEGNVTYIFVMCPQLREEGYISKCDHCGKKVWWEPYTGSFIHTVDNVHYYLPASYLFNNQGTVGRSQTSYPDALQYTAIFDMNGKTMDSKTRNFLVYANLILIDSVGGGVLQASGYNGGSGGNFLVSGGSVEINDGITVRRADNPNATSNGGGNFNVSRKIVTDAAGKTKTYIGTVTVNDAVLEGWENAPGGNFYMNTGSVLNLNSGVVKGGSIVLRGEATINWKGTKVESDVSLDGSTLALTGTPNFTGILTNTNGGKVDITDLSTDASIKVIPTGVFTTESDNIDAYLNVFTSAAPEACTIVKEGKALASKAVVPEITSNLAFIPGTQMAVCPVCEEMVTWTPITQETYGEQDFGGVGDLHAYLAEDITYTGTEAFMKAPSSSGDTPYEGCFHLNGHNITATNANVLRGGTGIFHVMGSGVVSGNGSDGATAYVSTNKNTGCLYLHSGTYVRAAGNQTGVIQINNGGGKIVIGKDAVVECAANTLAISVGESTSINSVLEIYGTVKGGYVQTADARATAGNTSTFVLDGGNVEGGIKLAATNVIRLTGVAKVGANGLDLTSGAKIQTSELTEGAVVTVKAEGVFTADIDAAGQQGFYEPAANYKAIEIVGQTLSTSAISEIPPEPEEPEVPNEPAGDCTADLEFISGTTAYCPVCDKNVEWTPITQEAYGTTAFDGVDDGQHVYLAEDITYTGTAIFMKAPGSTSSKIYEGCFHLNGHNITATNAVVFRGGTGILNVMGSGIVSGNGTDGATAYVSTNKETGCLYLHSGTYVRAAGNESGVIQINNGGGKIVVGKDAVVECAADTLAISVGKCSNIKSELEIYGTVKGGYIQMVDADPAKGHTSSFVLDGGNVEGGIKLAATNIIRLAGAAKVGANGLDLTSGAKIGTSELTEDAVVTVKAEGVFTADIDVAGQKDFYVPAANYKAIEIVGQTLSTSLNTDAPEIPDEPAADYTANLEFTSGTTAHCPVCDRDVEWTAITQEAYGETAFGNLVDGQHVYLAEDIVYTGSTVFVKSPGKPYAGCFHLNGHNITATGINVFQGGSGILNIMGNGIVAGGVNQAKNGAAVAINTNGPDGTVNLYGGTYTKTAAAVNSAVVALGGNGGKINIHKDVTVIGIDSTAAIFVGKAGLTAAVMNIDGATIHGGMKTEKPVKNSSSSSVTEFAGISNITLTDVELTAVELAQNVVFTINGNTKIAKLDVADGAKFTVGKLGSAAKIAVLGNGVVSEANTNMATYFAKFTPYYGELKVENNALVASHQAAVSTAELAFTEGTTATCPYCKKSVEWIGISQITETYVLEGEKHYYLVNDITASLTGDAVVYSENVEKKDACLHLNGHSLTNSQGVAIFAGNYLNIMGSGTVSGNGTVADEAATLAVNGTSARVNLLGGNYVKAAGNTANAIISVNAKGGIVNLYDGATVDGSDRPTEDSPACIRLNGTKGEQTHKAILNIYGGTIQNGVTTAGNGGNIRLCNNGEINMYDGTVTGGQATSTSGTGIGGNIHIGAGTANLLGGIISNGSARMGGNVAINKATATVGNASVIGGTSTNHGGNFSIENGGILNLESGAIVASGTAGGQGGNIRCYKATVSMNGGVVSGGVAQGGNNHNIWVTGAAGAPGQMTFSGGVVWGYAGATAAGSGIYASGTSELLLTGYAQVIDNCEYAGIRIAGSAAKLTTDDSWTGSANVANP